MERVLITGKAEDGRYIDSKGRFLSIMGDVNVSIGQYVWTNGKTIYGHQTAGNASIAPISKVMPLFDGQYWYKITTDPKDPIKRMGKSNIIAYCGDCNHAYVQLNNGHWYNLLTGEDLGDFSPIDACIGEKGELLTVEGGYIACEMRQQKKYNIYKTDWTYFKYKFADEFKSDLPPVDLYKTPVYKAEGPVIHPYVSKVEGYHYHMVKGKEINGVNSSFKDSELNIRRNGKIERKISLLSFFYEYVRQAAKEGKAIHNAGGAIASYPRPNWTESYYCSAYDHIKIMSNITIDGIITPNINLNCYPVFSHLMGTWALNKVQATYNYLIRKEDMIYINMGIPEVWKSEIIGEASTSGGDAVAPTIKNTTYNDWINANLYKELTIDLRAKAALTIKIGKAISSNSDFIGELATHEGEEKEYSLPVFDFKCKGKAEHTIIPTLTIVNLTQKRESYKNTEPNYNYWVDKDGNGHYSMGPAIERVHYKTVDDVSIKQNFYQIFINVNRATKQETLTYNLSKKITINNDFYSIIHLSTIHNHYKVDIYRSDGEFVYNMNIPDQLHPIYYDPISQKAGLLLNGTVVISDTSCNVVEFIKNGRLMKAYAPNEGYIFRGCYSLEYFNNGPLLAAKIDQMNKLQ